MCVRIHFPLPSIQTLQTDMNMLLIRMCMLAQVIEQMQVACKYRCNQRKQTSAETSLLSIEIGVCSKDRSMHHKRCTQKEGTVALQLPTHQPECRSTSCDTGPKL